MDEGLSAERSINLFHCLNELNDHSLVEQIQQSLSSGQLSEHLSPAEWSVLTFILLSSEEDLDVLCRMDHGGPQWLKPGLRKLTPREGYSAWGHSAGVQLEEEEGERKGSRKKGRSNNCGPYREHSADASVKPPHEGSRQRSCSAPNLRRSPRHSPAVPGVPSLLEMENEDSCFTTDPAAAAPGQSYLCLPVQKEGLPAASEGETGEESCLSAPPPGASPCRRSPGGGRRSDLVLLGCGALLAAAGLGCNLLTLSQPEENSPLKAPTIPSSYTLLSLSSVSDCNSTRSLLRSDSEEKLACRRPPASPLKHPPHYRHQPHINPLVNTHLESFKRHPRQSLTPTHIPSAPSASRSLRRTPSDGAIKKSCPPHSLEPLLEKTALENTGIFRGFKEDCPEVPRLPDPNLVFPPTPRRRCAPERPKTLDFVARPRPSPRIRCDVFWADGRPRGNGQNLGNGEKENLLDKLDEGQCRDGTLPLCKPETGRSKDSPYRYRPGYWS
ncbi:hypothetical protein JOQ06_021840 [Pogonophryne albipinna]|uniref:Uncharacterized protein n=2 Tax=Pogonophryne albipinna TaxID=1090488 RepID=A0AAD6F6J3_9TELE|nr:hypothetical protein JOQ06_021840 [Pogonophryne albipinna]